MWCSGVLRQEFSEYSSPQGGEYVLVAYGPDGKRNNPPGYGFPYQPSNGLTSLGDIWMRSGGGSNESY